MTTILQFSFFLNISSIKYINLNYKYNYLLFNKKLLKLVRNKEKILAKLLNKNSLID